LLKYHQRRVIIETVRATGVLRPGPGVFAVAHERTSGCDRDDRPPVAVRIAVSGRARALAVMLKGQQKIPRVEASVIGDDAGDLRGLKILVIDDSKTIRRTAETLLSREGCQVFTAVDGFDALAKIADHRPNIIFVDIMMPRLDGYQTCALIKHNRTFKDTPVIMLSSKDGLFDRARGRIVGSEHYLTKPFTKDELLGAIRGHVAR
jgi:twitching motility two-component system response regulator PilG